jgi:hypothetical protein
MVMVSCATTRAVNPLDLARLSIDNMNSVVRGLYMKSISGVEGSLKWRRREKGLTRIAGTTIGCHHLSSTRTRSE